MFCKISALAVAGLASIFVSLAGAQAEPAFVYHHFTSPYTGHFPTGGIIRDQNGFIYGVAGGGAHYNAGVLYVVTPAGGESVLHEFAGTDNGDGSTPQGELMMDARDFIYGTTRFGGSANCGTVYKVARSGGAYKVLYSFPGGDGGCQPQSRLAMDQVGNLYGISQGGTNGLGLVFELDPYGTATVLMQFSAASGGYPANSGLIIDAAGNLYGTTSQGGLNGGGTVFRISPNGRYTTLHSFRYVAGNVGEGLNPEGGVIMDDAGNLYGTLYSGGAFGNGSVFKLAPSGGLFVLHSFNGGSQGGSPEFGLVMDAQGNLYGNAHDGRFLPSCSGNCGVVFQITQGGQAFALHQFAGNDGWSPVGDLTMDAAGHLYGAAKYGGASDGSGGGTIVRLTE